MAGCGDTNESSHQRVFGAALEDGSWPPEVGLQKLASNRLGAAAPKRCGGERLEEKGAFRRQVSVEKMSASEPSD